jgi:hypothetical protein
MAPRTCRICGRSDPPGGCLSSGRCRMCHGYWRHHGVERLPGPPRPPATLRSCTHCGQVTWTPERGRCSACYHYWLRYGTERLPGPRPPPALPDVRPARATVPPRPVQCLLPVLVSDGPRAAAPPPAKRCGGPTLLYALRAADLEANTQLVPGLLQVLVAPRPRAPAAVVVPPIALYGPQDGRTGGVGRYGWNDGHAHLSRLWAHRPARGLPRQRALSDVPDVLVPAGG